MVTMLRPITRGVNAIIRSVPELLANAYGLRCEGPCRCFYCGAACDAERYPASTYVKSSFNGRGEVAAPGSPAVCEGCVLALREKAPIVLIDGERRDGQMMRGYSHVLHGGRHHAATKAHLDRIRALCLDPPEPPFAIVLSDSGQTHQIYRGVVNHSRETVVATLEGARVAFRPDELRERLSLCGKLVAATGKPALSESVTTRFAVAVMERFRDGEILVEEWVRAREQPLSRLAAWLCPNKEASNLEHPCDAGHGIAAAETGRAGGPAVKHARKDRKGRDPRRGDPVLFDPG